MFKDRSWDAKLASSAQQNLVMIRPALLWLDFLVRRLNAWMEGAIVSEIGVGYVDPSILQ